MSALIAAGATSAPSRETRFWWVAPDRKVAWLGSGEPVRLRTPIPGLTAVALIDPQWRDPLAILASGEVWRCASQLNEQPWIGGGNLFANEGGHEMTTKQAGKDDATTAARTITVAGVERRESGSWRLWFVANRQAFLSGESFQGRPVGSPVPGDLPIRTLRLTGDRTCEVLLGDGSLLAWGPRGWSSIGSGFDQREGGDAMKVVALRGFCYAVGKDCAVGDVIELSAADARRLIAAGKVQAVGDAEGPTAA